MKNFNDTEQTSILFVPHYEGGRFNWVLVSPTYKEEESPPIQTEI